MSWWISQTARARSERLAIADLLESSNWVKTVEWKLADDLHLSANVVIAIGDQDISLKLTYPAFFPDVPPQVYPDGEVRLSQHQYGAGGELCLEYRPDNWEPSVTGAMMLESAYRLLSSEQQDGTERPEVPNAHRTTVAQDVRNQSLRFLLPSDAKEQLEALLQSSVTEVAFEEIAHARMFLARISRIGSEEQPLWQQPMASLSPARWSGYALRLPDPWTVSIPTSFDQLVDFADRIKEAPLRTFLEDFSRERTLIFVAKDFVRFVSLMKGEESKEGLIYKVVPLPPPVQRQGDEYAALNARSVAIVGCGSVGSKVAASLARAGVGNFLLVDGDIFFPGNIVRNDLDMRSVGLNKPDAVKARIQEISPNAKVDVRRVLMGGQESSSATEAALQRIAKCDLIVDATADATIFNLCAAVSRVERKPLVWGEVFAGGVGGIVARARPDIDPTPLLARKQLAAWCADQGMPWNGQESAAYDVARDDAPPLVADDAEVTIIAAHITRFATDILVRETSVFPQSAYVTGFRQEWIFEAPFDTRPIDLQPDGQWQQPFTEEQTGDLIALMGELFPKTEEA